MSSTVHFSLARNPQLVDMVDDEWEKETLPVDGTLLLPPLHRHLFFGLNLSLTTRNTHTDAILPDGVETIIPEPDESLNERKEKEPEGWGDLGLQGIN